MTSIQVAFVILVLRRFEILDHCIHLPRNRYKVKITEFSAATPPKSTSANKRLLGTPERKSPIRKSVRAVIAGDQNKQGKVFTEIFGICAGKASSI